MRVWIALLRICINLPVLLFNYHLRLDPLLANWDGELHEHCRRCFGGDEELTMRRLYHPKIIYLVMYKPGDRRDTLYPHRPSTSPMSFP